MVRAEDHCDCGSLPRRPPDLAENQEAQKKAEALRKKENAESPDATDGALRQRWKRS